MELHAAIQAIKEKLEETRNEENISDNLAEAVYTILEAFGDLLINFKKEN